MELFREIPGTGERVPAVGLGTWQTFDPPYLTSAALGPLEEVLRSFHAAGGRVVDTSPMYGKAERVVGVLAQRLHAAELFLATKVWTSGKASGLRQLETSLRELKRERLDLVAVHNLLDWETQLATLRGWKEEGRIRYVGVTHYHRGAFGDLEWVLSRAKVDFVQLPYSPGMRAAEEKLLPLAAEKGIAVMVNRPFEEGALLKRVAGRPLPEPALRWAASWPEAILKWILAHPAVTCVIPATRRPEHVAEIVRAGVGPLPDEEERRLLVEALG
jgi:diketogulonate reductase-like aldo/keto reductase